MTDVSARIFYEDRMNNPHFNLVTKQSPLYRPLTHDTPLATRRTVPYLNNLDMKAYRAMAWELLSFWLYRTDKLFHCEKTLIRKMIPEYSPADVAAAEPAFVNKKSLFMEYFNRVAKHKRWMFDVWVFLRASECHPMFSQNADCDAQLVRIAKHDLSKFTPDESLGFIIMFGTGPKTLRTLTGREKVEWDLALDHHYRYNPHHPEYFTDGSNMGDFLWEGLVDLIARRLETRTEKGEAFTVTLAEMCQVGDWLKMRRFTDSDLATLQQFINRMTKGAIQLVCTRDGSVFMDT